MDIETMKTFLVLADTKNFTRTAHQLFIAQSTVTNRILELEKELNVTLFERNNRSVELTPAGERFSLYASSVIRLTDTAMAEIGSIHKFENTLRIGSSDSVYEAHLAPIIQAHQRNHPEDALENIDRIVEPAFGAAAKRYFGRRIFVYSAAKSQISL